MSHRNVLFLACVATLCLASPRAAAGGPAIGLVSVWIPKACPDELRAPGREREWNECFETRQNPEFEKARKWYAEMLGYKVTSDVHGVFDGVAGRWIQLKLPGQLVQIVLKARSPITDDASFTLAFRFADELCRYYGQLVRRGVELDAKFGVPTHQPWAFEFAVRDPNHQLIVVNVPAENLAREEALRRAGKIPARRHKCGTEL